MLLQNVVIPQIEGHQQALKRSLVGPNEVTTLTWHIYTLNYIPILVGK